MLVAIDEKNNRIIPEKNKLGFCQLCKKPVRAYCGEINVHHWRHLELQNCDAWKEHESEWHREWKNKFPKEWQEIIIENQFEKHIADIKTPNGLILELQNSSISSTTIQIRENFYENMVWLINANKFKGNFVIGSIVTTQLRYLDTAFKSGIAYSLDDKSEAKEAKKEKSDIEKEISDNAYNISNIERKVENIKGLELNINNTIKDFIESKYYYSSPLDEFKTDFKKYIIDSDLNIETLNKELDSKTSILNEINLLNSCKIENYLDYKYINYNEVSSSSFSKCAIIEKETEDTFFPIIRHFKSQNEFDLMARNPRYRLIVNPTDKLNKTQKRIEIIKGEIKALIKIKSTAYNNLLSQIKKFLKEYEISLKNRLNEFKINKILLNSDLADKIKSISLIEEKELIENKIILKELERKHDKKRFEIMKEYKGLYSYRWKHKRKSWNFSTKNLYLDFENHIFEMIDEDTFRKMKTSDFIKFIKTDA